MKSINLPYVLLISIILGMGYYIIFIQPKTTVDTFDEAPLREEIRIQDSISVYWKYQRLKGYSEIKHSDVMVFSHPMWGGRNNFFIKRSNLFLNNKIMKF